MLEINLKMLLGMNGITLQSKIAHLHSCVNNARLTISQHAERTRRGRVAGFFRKIQDFIHFCVSYITTKNLARSISRSYSIDLFNEV